MKFKFEEYLKQSNVTYPGFVVIAMENIDGVKDVVPSYTLDAGCIQVGTADEETSISIKAVETLISLVVGNAIVAALVEAKENDPRVILESDGGKYALCSFEHGSLQAQSLQSQNLKYGLITKCVQNLRIRERRIVFHKGGRIWTKDGQLHIALN